MTLTEAFIQYLVATVPLVQNGDLESITEDTKSTSEPIEANKEPETIDQSTSEPAVIAVEPENTGVDHENVDIGSTPSVETPKAIRQSARRRSATPKKAQPSPRHDSQKTIGKSLNNKPRNYSITDQILVAAVSLTKTGDLDPITEVDQSVVEPTDSEPAKEAVAAESAIENVVMGLQTPKAVRQSARRRSATPSKTQEKTGKSIKAF
jgi:hypothetical protein